MLTAHLNELAQCCAQTLRFGEYVSRNRRQWRALSLFAPSLDLSPDYTDLLRDAPYP